MERGPFEVELIDDYTARLAVGGVHIQVVGKSLQKAVEAKEITKEEANERLAAYLKGFTNRETAD